MTKYTTGKINIDSEIEELAKKYSTPQTRSYIHDLFTTVIKLHLDNADEQDLYLANTALKELRHIFRTFAKYRCERKVAIFGSHRTPPKTKEYKITEEFAKKIAASGWMVITGGGGGVMEAANKGAGKRGFAVKIKLPNEFQPNPYVYQGEKLINVKYFFTRKLAFIKESDATVLFPGGFGTHDEGFEVLTLMQTGKCLPRPLVFVESPGKRYWHNWLSFVKKSLVKDGYLLAQDLKIFNIVHSADEAVKVITDFYRVYHSIRFARDLTVIRLTKRLADNKLERLSKKYQDILDGQITPSGPLPVEVREKDLLELPRICFKFNRKSYGRLMELIRDLNT
ncbi:MAG: TIGR00730 family Rossman fold protein [bacterium]